MSDKTDERVADALAHNFGELLERGPGLRFSTRAVTAAKCPTGKHRLRTGLGAMGVGSMWGDANDDDRADPLWDELPVEQCSSSLGMDPCKP